MRNRFGYRQIISKIVFVGVDVLWLNNRTVAIYSCQPCLRGLAPARISDPGDHYVFINHLCYEGNIVSVTTIGFTPLDITIFIGLD